MLSLQVSTGHGARRMRHITVRILGNTSELCVGVGWGGHSFLLVAGSRAEENTESIIFVSLMSQTFKVLLNSKSRSRLASGHHYHRHKVVTKNWFDSNTTDTFHLSDCYKQPTLVICVLS